MQGWPPVWHKELLGVCSNCKADPGMGEASGKMPCLLVPVKRAGGHRQCPLGATCCSPLCPSFLLCGSLQEFGVWVLTDSVCFSPFSSFPQSVLNVISELQEQMCRLQLDIHRQIQERLLLNRDHPEEVAAGDGVAGPQACSQDCARWEGSPVGTTQVYQSMRVWGVSLVEGRGVFLTGTECSGLTGICCYLWAELGTDTLPRDGS